MEFPIRIGGSRHEQEAEEKMEQKTEQKIMYKKDSNNFQLTTIYIPKRLWEETKRFALTQHRRASPQVVQFIEQGLANAKKGNEDQESITS